MCIHLGRQKGVALQVLLAKIIFHLVFNQLHQLGFRALHNCFRLWFFHFYDWYILCDRLNLQKLLL